MVFGAFSHWRDKHLAHAGGPMEGFALSVYGKLPIYKDYIIWECHQDGAADFKRWLDDAFA